MGGFTPGPLEARPEPGAANDGLYMVVDLAGTAEMHGSSVLTASYCTKADATLYASAPDLLEALAEGVELQARHHGDGTGLHIAMIAWAERARAAIARATGEQG